MASHLYYNSNSPINLHIQITPSTTFEAATAVLDTNELLHLIIAEVPHEYRTSLRRISKAWQAAVEKLGHALEPVLPVEDEGRWTSMPLYQLGKPLVCNKVNPVIACYTKDTEYDCPGCDTCWEGIDGIQASICFDPDGVSSTLEGVRRETEFSSSRTRPSQQ